MAKENETVADIIAEMRRYATDYYGRTIENGGEKGNPGMFYCDMAQFAKVNADRLEAAHEREVDALNEQIADLRQQRDLWSKRAAELVEKCNEQYAKLKQVGNAAKLREACANIAAYARSAQCHATDAHILGYLSQIEMWACAALAAPPRNCDVHTADELKAIFKSELASELPIANEHAKNLVTITAMGVVDTLFATTKKGGNDADK